MIISMLFYILCLSWFLSQKHFIDNAYAWCFLNKITSAIRFAGLYNLEQIKIATVVL